MQAIFSSASQAYFCQHTTALPLLFRFIFEDHLVGRENVLNISIKFALPGKERFDSVYNGFKVRGGMLLVCLVDGCSWFAWVMDAGVWL